MLFPIGVTIDDVPMPYGFAGDNVTLTLTGIDLQHLTVGSILCEPSSPIPVTSRIRARVVIFNIDVPLTQGFPVRTHTSVCHLTLTPAFCCHTLTLTCPNSPVSILSCHHLYSPVSPKLNLSLYPPVTQTYLSPYAQLSPHKLTYLEPKLTYLEPKLTCDHINYLFLYSPGTTQSHVSLYSPVPPKLISLSLLTHYHLNWSQSLKMFNLKWAGRIAKWVELPSPVWEIRGFGPMGLNPGRSKNDIKIYTWCFLVRSLSLLGYGKDRLAQCRDNVTEWNFGSWCCWPCLSVRQHYKVYMDVPCHKSVAILIWT